MLVPRAVIPPSAMKSACTSSTVVTQRTPGPGADEDGRHRAAERCPLVPAPTGKFIICPAKTNVATRPAIGAVLSSSSRRAPRRATATPPAATTAVTTEVGASRNPSGTCIRDTLLTASCSQQAGPAEHSTRERPAPSPSARLSPGDTAPDFTLPDRHRRRSRSRRPARAEGDRVLLPGRDDPRLHQAGLRLHRLPRLAARRGLRGDRHLPGQARRSWPSSASATA